MTTTRFNFKESTKQFYIILALCSVFIIASCSKDDETNVDAKKISGTFDVVETDEFDDVENYSITIAKSKNGGANIEINNFGDFMYVPVKAVIKGNVFTIPPQTFVGKKLTISVSGSGTFNGTVLTFDFSLDTGNDIVINQTCVASKVE